MQLTTSVNSPVPVNPAAVGRIPACRREEWEAVSGPLKSRETVLAEIQNDPAFYQLYLQLSDTAQEELIAFAMGVRGVRMVYDTMFKTIFNPQTHPERLEELIGLLYGEHLRIVQVYPNRSQHLSEEGSLLIMDVVVQLESGVLVNIEIQRIGYDFPGPRCACYSSDLVMRQYSQIRARKRQEKETFSYHDIKKVCTIVLIQSSTQEFHDFPGQYLHYSRQTFNTGLDLDLIQEYLLIPLDIFLKTPHNEITRLDAWLYFLASDKPEDILRVITAHPDFRELFAEVFRFRHQGKELIHMFSEALRILDINTTQLMIENLRKEAATLKEETTSLKEENVSLEKELAFLRDQNLALQAQLAAQ